MDNPSEPQLRRIYAESKTIAVVGMSSDESKSSHVIPRYLQNQGYRIIPISPRGGEILGEKVFSSLEEAGLPIDVVNVFRPSEEAPSIARSAGDIGAKVLWLQEGIYSEDAAAVAKESGMTVVMNACIGVTHQRLGLGPGPWV
jgi:hypothetical protein